MKIPKFYLCMHTVVEGLNDRILPKLFCIVHSQRYISEILAIIIAVTITWISLSLASVLRAASFTVITPNTWGKVFDKDILLSINLLKILTILPSKTMLHTDWKWARRNSTSLYEASITSIPKSKTGYEKESYRTNPWWIQMQRFSTNQIQNHIKKIITSHHDSVGSIPEMQGWLNIHKPINIINHINRIKTKNTMFISMDAKKTFDKIQHFFMVKTFHNLV